VTELVARQLPEPKVEGSNPRAEKKFFGGKNYLEFKSTIIDCSILIGHYVS
jgi:hypothetical protein